MTHGSRGQSLVELALCAPILVLFALGATAAVQVANADAGLEAATHAAAVAAARAPNAASAVDQAQRRFESMVAGYPLDSAVIQVTFGGFTRGDKVVASASGSVDISWAAFFLPAHVGLSSRVAVPLEQWRTHRGSG